jgi:hypothetical protein
MKFDIRGSLLIDSEFSPLHGKCVYMHCNSNDYSKNGFVEFLDVETYTYAALVQIVGFERMIDPLDSCSWALDWFSDVIDPSDIVKVRLNEKTS